MELESKWERFYFLIHNLKYSLFKKTKMVGKHKALMGNGGKEEPESIQAKD